MLINSEALRCFGTEITFSQIVELFFSSAPSLSFGLFGDERNKSFRFDCDISLTNNFLSLLFLGDAVALINSQFINEIILSRRHN